jgi:FlaA1/EpsC-like NDP-sugar epimerase
MPLQTGFQTLRTPLTDSILNLSRFCKRAIALAMDAVLCLVSVAVAYYLRVGEWVYPERLQWLSYAGALALAIPMFVNFGLYRAIFRYAGWGALMAVVRACAAYGAIYGAVFTAIGVAGVPRTIGLIQPILLFLAVGASRALARYWLSGGYLVLMRLGTQRRVLIYGAGSAGRQLAAGLATSDEVEVVAFVDDDETLHGSVLNGKMIYSPDGLEI